MGSAFFEKYKNRFNSIISVYILPPGKRGGYIRPGARGLFAWFVVLKEGNAPSKTAASA
jgi:hypothetical protein